MGNLICNYWWYWLIAALVSIYQGYRGARFQYSDKQKETESWFLYIIPDCILYFITTFSGFIALFFIFYVLKNTSVKDISVGSAALLIFAALYGILGVTGQLPHLLQQGKFPR